MDQLIRPFNLNPEDFHDVDVSLLYNYTLLKTGAYSIVLALMNQLCPHLTRYYIHGMLIKLAL